MIVGAAESEACVESDRLQAAASDLGTNFCTRNGGCIDESIDIFIFIIDIFKSIDIFYFESQKIFRFFL